MLQITTNNENNNKKSRDNKNYFNLFFLDRIYFLYTAI